MGCDTSVSDGDWLIDDVSIIDVGIGGPCETVSRSLIFGDGFESGDTTLVASTVDPVSVRRDPVFEGVTVAEPMARSAHPHAPQPVERRHDFGEAR